MGPRFETVVSHECVTVHNMRQRPIERPHGWPALMLWFGSFRPAVWHCNSCLLSCSTRLLAVVPCDTFCL